MGFYFDWRKEKILTHHLHNVRWQDVSKAVKKSFSLSPTFFAAYRGPKNSIRERWTGWPDGSIIIFNIKPFTLMRFSLKVHFFAKVAKFRQIWSHWRRSQLLASEYFPAQKSNNLKMEVSYQGTILQNWLILNRWW